MALEGIKSTAYNAGKEIVNKGSTVAHALGRAFEYTGKALTEITKKIADWVKTNLPVYSQYTIDYAKLGFQYLKSGIKYIQENKSSVGVGVGMGVGLAALVYTTHHFFFKSND